MAIVSTGFRDLDKTIIGLHKGDLILLAARPGMGKKSLALSIALNVAKQNKLVCYFSYGSSSGQITERVNLQASSENINNSQIHIFEASRMGTQEIKEKLSEMENVDLVVIDYLQLVKLNSQSRLEIIHNLKLMAEDLDIPFLVLSQLSKTVEQRTDKRPLLTDIELYNTFDADVDIVLFLYREGYYSDEADKTAAECIIAKNKHGDIGVIPLRWDREYLKFASCDS